MQLSSTYPPFTGGFSPAPAASGGHEVSWHHQLPCSLASLLWVRSWASLEMVLVAGALEDLHPSASRVQQLAHSQARSLTVIFTLASWESQERGSLGTQTYRTPTRLCVQARMYSLAISSVIQTLQHRTRKTLPESSALEIQ